MHAPRVARVDDAESLRAQIRAHTDPTQGESQIDGRPGGKNELVAEHALEAGAGGDEVTEQLLFTAEVAVPLRSEAPVFADDELLELTALEIEEGDFEDEDELWKGSAEPSEELEAPEEEKEELRDYLKRLNPEDFGRFNP